MYVLYGKMFLWVWSFFIGIYLDDVVCDVMISGVGINFDIIVFCDGSLIGVEVMVV